MRKIIVFAGIMLIFGISLCYAQEEEKITITTYYPSPYGVYRELRSQRQAIGDNYYDPSQYCWGFGCLNPIDDDVDLVVEGKVGIGTTDPSQVLDVNGGIQIGNTTNGEGGAIRWTGSEFQGHNGKEWTSLGGGRIKIFYATEKRAEGKDRSVPSYEKYYHYYDDLTLYVPVKKGDIVKVTVAGAIRGDVYTVVHPRNLSGWKIYKDGLNFASWIASTAVVTTGPDLNDWVPLHLTTVVEATADTTLVFQQGFNPMDRSGAAWVAARIAVAEVISP